MKLSALMTLYERPIPVLEAVFDSLKDQDHDELVIALDRTPVVLADFVMDYWKGDKRVQYATLDGPPGWRSPVPAWNAAFATATGDLLYAFSSETIQNPGNLATARKELTAEAPWPTEQRILTDPTIAIPLCLHGSASCSCGPSGQEVNWNGTAPGNLLCDAAHARPLGFIWAAPAANVRQIGGYDPVFSAGLWYDDNDFFIRLWRSGLDFIYLDSLSGIHQHHDRPVLPTSEGQQAIARNQALMLSKHGSLDPWQNTFRTESRQPGRTTWRHL